MHKTPTVAVVTRTKDRPMLLARAIESALGQTMRDFHMIIVNDGGDPGAVDRVVAQHSDRASGRIDVLHHRESKGMEAASNLGLRATSSRYVALLDDDDTWDPRFLELTVAMAEAREAMGVVTDSTVVLERVVDGDIHFLESFPFDPTPGPWMTPRPPNNLIRLLSWNQFPPCAFMYRRSVLDEIGYYDETLPVLGDWDFNLRFIAKHQLAHLASPLANYHHRLNETTSNSVHGRETLHEQVRLDLLDRYLRQELRNGKLGVGFATNLLYEMRQTNDALAGRLEDLDRRLALLDQSVTSVGATLERFIEHDRHTASVERPSSPLSPVRAWRRYDALSLLRRCTKQRPPDSGDPGAGGTTGH